MTVVAALVLIAVGDDIAAAVVLFEAALDESGAALDEFVAEQGGFLAGWVWSAAG